ncbi:MAG: helix-turn-helix transcriptional regulator [Pseudomonadota bacterium]
MLRTPSELLQALGDQIKIRRLGMGLTQQQAALRAGVAYRTWRRLEREGGASIEDLVKAAIALRCEEGLEGLFPPPVASSLDDLLKGQATAFASASRARGGRTTTTPARRP